MKALVTGGAGYIGSHTVRALLDAGHEVRVLDDLSGGHLRAVADGVELVIGDIGDGATVTRALEGCDAVLHFAALLSVVGSVRDPLAYWRNNVARALRLIEAMDQAGVRRFVFSSTCATFGVPVRTPMDEQHPQHPINPYGASKLALERALRDLAAAGVLRTVALRYFNAAGAHQDGSLGEDHAHEEHLIPLAIDAALGRRPGLTIFGDDYDTPDGTCIRDYIHVQDLAVAHVQALAALDAGDTFQAYNLGTGHGHSVREVVECVGRVMGQPVPHTIGPRRAGDPPRLVASSERARQALGFVPRFADLGTIVETAARWRRDHPQGYRTES